MERIVRISFCPHCSNRAPHRLVHIQEGEEVELFYTIDGEERTNEWMETYYIAICETCERPLVYLAEKSRHEEDFSDAHRIWPVSGLDPAVPKIVGKCYQEAASIKNRAPNAFAGQIRRALEALCDNRGAKKGTLHIRLKELADKGEIPPILAEMTDVLRLIGNVGVHSVSQSVELYQVNAIDEFFRAVVEYVYVAPEKVKRFREQMEWFKTGES